MNIPDLSILYAPPKNWEPLRVVDKATGQVVMIKSNRFNPALHTLVGAAGTTPNYKPTPVEINLSDLPKEPAPVEEVKEPEAVETLNCSKCGKTCASKAGKSSHERACK